MKVRFKFANLKQNFGPPKILANEPKVKKSENSDCSNKFCLLKMDSDRVEKCKI